MKRLIFLSLCYVFTGLGCAYVNHGDPKDVTTTSVKTFAVNELKLISPEITLANDPSASLRYDYKISQTSRVLLRLGALKGLSGEILDEQPILLRIAPDPGAPIETAKENLRLCPLSKNWMMYATWTRAHPYNEGLWKSSGGDFEAFECLQPIAADSTLLTHEEEKAFCDPSSFLCFDIGKYTRSNVKARNINYGWILTSNKDALVIYGDLTTRGPEVFYRKFR